MIKQTIGENLPEGFQTAEFLVEHGFVDGIVLRRNLKKTLYFLIHAHQCVGKKSWADFKGSDFHFHMTEILKERMWYEQPKSAWDKVKGVRDRTPVGP